MPALYIAKQLMPAMTLRVEGSRALFDMQESLEKLEALEIKRIYPGHGRPYSDVKSALAKSKAKIESYFGNRELIGQDLIKKILVYTLLMKRTIQENDFYPYLMDTIWYPETVDLYFNGEYEKKYDEVMRGFLKRGVVKRKGASLFTTVKP